MSKYVRSNYVSQNSEPTDYASEGATRRELQAQLAALREENERLRNELKRITKPGEDLHDWLIEGKIPRPEES
jgi:hypothetical protein